MKRKRHVPFSIGWDALGINVQLAFSILDEFVEAVPDVDALVGLKVIVDGLDDGLGALVHVMSYDFSHTSCRVPYVVEVERLVIAVKHVTLWEVLKAVGRE